jgi:hypothetical protein
MNYKTAEYVKIMGKLQTSLDHGPTNIQHCKYCDAELVAHARFCSVCGALAEQVEPPELEEHNMLQRWQSIGKSMSVQSSAGHASPSAAVTNRDKTLDDASVENDGFQAKDALSAEDIDEEAEDEKSYTQPHLSAVIANIGRRQKTPDAHSSTPAGQKSLSTADEPIDVYRYNIEDYDTMQLRAYAPVPKPVIQEVLTEGSVALRASSMENQSTSAQLAEALDMSQTQSMRSIARVGKRAASIPVETRETQGVAAPAVSEGEHEESTRVAGIASAIWPLILIGAAIATALLVYVTPGLPLRPYVVQAFLILCPGMALIRLLRLRDVAVEWTLAIALSIVLDGTVPTIQLYAHLWSPDVSLAILLGITVLAALAWFINPRPRAINKVEPA